MTVSNQMTARLQYNDELLTLLPLGPDGNPLPGAAPLVQAAFTVECTDPRCVSGTPPARVGLPQPGGEEPVQITQGPDLQPRLLAGADGTSRSLFVLDGSLLTPCADDCGKRDGKGNKAPCGGLCGELAQRRKADTRFTKFWVYRVTSATDELSRLQGKLIAVPVLKAPAENAAAASLAS